MVGPFKPERDRVGLPPRTFFYTIDQICTMLECDENYLKESLLHYMDRDPGIPSKDKMRAINIAPEGETPVWRISEQSFLGYLRRRGVKFYERGYVL